MKKLLSALLGIFGLFIVPAYAALPSGYTQLEYINMPAGAYLLTDIIPVYNGHYEIDFQTTEIQNSGVILGGRTEIYGGMLFTIASDGMFMVDAFGTNSTGRYTSSVLPAANTRYKFIFNNKVATLESGDSRLFEHTFTGTGANGAVLVIKGANTDGSIVGNNASYYIYSFQAWNPQGTLIANFIPAKNASGVVGMYDTVNNRFYTNAGTGEFIAGDPVTDNPCRNLFNKDAGYINAYINANSGVLTSGDSQYSFVIPVQPNTKYTLSGMSSGSTWGSFTDNTIGTTATSKLAGNGTITTGANDRYLIGLAYATGTQYDYRQTLQIEEGDTATAYTPYNPSCGCNGELVTYTSATGTVVQDGTPTLDNPIDPVFYQQGNMVLRKVGDYADSYDATTGKITRRVGVKVLDGTETWSYNEAYSRFVTSLSNLLDANARTLPFVCTHCQATRASETTPGYIYNATNQRIMITDSHTTVGDWKQWLAQQYAAGTPVTVWYPLETETTEDWPASQCTTDPIKIATTKYNETKFSPLNTALANAISVVDTVVSNTITQAGRIATLQAQKQTRPNDIADDNEKCPAGKKCLLVEDASGIPHWYEIVERYSLLPDGYTELQWIESTGTQYIDTGVNPKPNVTSVEFELAITDTSTEQIFGARQTSSATTGSYNIFANVSPKQFRLDWVGSSGTVVDGIVVGTFYKFVLNADGSVDFQNEHFESAATKVACDYNMYLFGGNSAGTTAFGKVRYKGAVKIKERDTLVRDFVPAKNASGVVGMYDIVSGVFYENKGTGEFIAGDPVSE